MAVAPDRISRGLGVWAVEFVSAVLMILANKVLMSGALAFRFPVTLTAAHFAWTAAGSSLAHACTRAPGEPAVALPPWHVVGAFVVLSSAAIILSNASLLLNSVAFYQCMKLATLPFVACVEWAAGTKAITRQHCLLYACILLGVGLTIVGDVAASLAGGLVACLSFSTAGLHQFFCARLQAGYGLSPARLLAAVSPAKALLLFAAGPPLDTLFGGWIGAYRWSPRAAALVAATCSLAVVLNLAQYTAVSSLGPGTYQALSQLKTAAVVVLGSWYFQGRVDPRQLAGTAAAACAVAVLTRYERSLAAAYEQLPVKQPEGEGGRPAPAGGAPAKGELALAKA